MFMFKSITLEVVGDQPLACEHCKQRVERLLKSLKGLVQVQARTDDQRIEVLFNPAVLEVSEITKVLGKAGYETKAVSSTPE